MTVTIMENDKDMHRFTVKQNKELFLYEVMDQNAEEGGETQPNLVRGVNSQYCFAAKYKNDGWTLAQIEFDCPTDSELVYKPARIDGYNFQSLAWTIGGHSVPELVNSSDFKLLRYDRDAAQAEFSVSMADVASVVGKVGIKKATVTFDPANKWRIQNYDLIIDHSPVSPIQSVKIEYDQDNFIHKVSMTGEIPGKYNVENTFTRDSLVFRNIPEYEFSLSYYGLPEPEGVSWTKPTPMYVWYIVGGVAFVFVSLAVGYWQRRLLLTRGESS